MQSTASPTSLSHAAANVADFTFTIDNGPDDALCVVRFIGDEAISELYAFRVELVSQLEPIDPRSVLGHRCLLKIHSKSGTVRYVHGLIRAFERAHRTASKTHYIAQVVPAHWLLTRRSNCRIFQEHNCPDMTVPGIVKFVLASAGLADDTIRLALEKTYTPREYVVQYRESEWNFICRLLEEEGIFFFFDHLPEREVLVLGDSRVAYNAVSETAEYPFVPPGGMVETDEAFRSVTWRHEAQHTSVSLDDHNFQKPGVDLDVLLEPKDTDLSGLHFRDFPGGFTEREDGQARAQLRMEEFIAARETLELDSGVRCLFPAGTFILADHPDAALNREYLVKRLVHKGSQPQSGEADETAAARTTYDVHVAAIPASVLFRPKRITPKPFVRGSQTAIVVGPKTEEVYVDKYGRVKVQFPWDAEGGYDENSSCWIRVSQGWAGGKYGMMFLPRVGHEVIVDFLEGDPDKPIVTGRVYNGDLSPIWDLPDRKYRGGIKSQSTKGGDGASALIFNDEKGDEYVHLHSQGYMEQTTEGDRVDATGGDLDASVKGGRWEKVGSHYQVGIGADHDVRVGGDESRDVSGNLSINCHGQYFVGTNAMLLSCSKKIVIEAGSSITLKVGGNFIKIGSSGIFIKGSTVKINSGGAAGSDSAPEFCDLEDVDTGSDVSHGYDVSYNHEAQQPGDAQPSGGDESAKTEDDTETTWIEIELVDEANQPWPNEEFEIVAPDGTTVYKGTLDKNGQAHVQVNAPGDCKISFPNLDQDAWERT